MTSFEIELKYFLTLDRAKAVLAQNNHITKNLEQSFFKKSELVQIYEQCFTVNERSLLIDQCTAGRVRKEIFNQRVSYCVTFKGPKDKDLNRIELEKSISEELYQQLLKHELRGTIAKDRHVVAGSLELDSGEVIDLKAEIDLVTSLKLPFATVDVELPDTQYIYPFREKKHSFDFLKEDALELSIQDKKLRSFLNMKHLARYGYDQDAQNAAAYFLARL
ncbi:MAG: hypothetical protein H6619_00040 [Deltaproteobacteria bacterium]|nr:hypothetical protein [Deltaproteobacteria bacterium]